LFNNKNIYEKNWKKSIHIWNDDGDFIFQILDSHLTDKVQDLFHNESTEHWPFAFSLLLLFFLHAWWFYPSTLNLFQPFTCTNKSFPVFLQTMIGCVIISCVLRSQKIQKSLFLFFLLFYRNVEGIEPAAERERVYRPENNCWRQRVWSPSKCSSFLQLVFQGHGEKVCFPPVLDLFCSFCRVHLCRLLFPPHLLQVWRHRFLSQGQ